MSKLEWLFVCLVAIVMFYGIWQITHHKFQPIAYKTAVYCSSENKFCWDETQQNSCVQTSYYQFGWGGESLRGYLRSCK